MSDGDEFEAVGKMVAGIELFRVGASGFSASVSINRPWILSKLTSATLGISTRARDIAQPNLSKGAYGFGPLVPCRRRHWTHGNEENLDASIG
jgi:hypothetical protein